MNRLLKGLCILLAVALLTGGILLGAYLLDPVRRVPSLSQLHAMGSEEGLAAVRDLDIETMMRAWGEPTSSGLTSKENGGLPAYYLWKLPDRLDYVKIFVEPTSHTPETIFCMEVFKGHIVYASEDLTWGTIAPLPHEEEAAFGDLIRINLASSRPAVIECLDPMSPIFVYYEGDVHPAADQELPYINTVSEMHYYDYVLEPIENQDSGR